MEKETKKQQASYNTTDLAADLAKQLGFSKAQALRVVTATFALIGNAVSRNDMVRLHQFGNFKKIETKERQGRNPKTGESTVIEASARPHFVASQAFKTKVKEGTQDVIENIVKEEATQAQPAPKAAPADSSKRKPIARKPAPKAKPVVSEEPALEEVAAIDEL